MGKRIMENISSTTLAYYITNSHIPKNIIEKKVPKLDMFLSGEAKPTFNQLVEMSKIIRVPTGMLLLKDPIDIENKRLEFRTLDLNQISEMSSELRDTISDMEIKQEFLREEVENELDYINMLSTNTDYVYIAEYIRNLLDVPIRWQEDAKGDSLKYFREKMNSIGVFVFFNGKVKSNTHRPLNVNEFRGFTLIDKKAPIIFINQADSKNGQLFTLIHEFAHLLIGGEGILNNFNYRMRIMILKYWQIG